MGTPCHFALFELQPSFNLDLDQLATRYRELARGVHPDRFADASEREQRLALEQGCEEGFRVVMNCNPKGGQTVYHIHMHVLGQRQMNWPPG